MASCYGQEGMAGPAQIKRAEALGYLPLRTRLKDGTLVEVDTFRPSEHQAGWALLNHELEEGRSWPFESQLSLDGFRAYFLSHAAFVVRRAVDGDNDDEDKGEDEDGHGDRVLGAFYVKPNFPGRCAHICNGGFITRVAARNRGVGTVMGQSFLRLARDLGYQSSYFNLVFATNVVSIRLWDKLGFRRLATVPKAARLKGERGLVDAHMYYYDLTTYRGRGPPPADGADQNDDDDEEEESPLSFSPQSFAAFWRGLLGMTGQESGGSSGSGIGSKTRPRRAFWAGVTVGLGAAVSTLAILRRARLLRGGGGGGGGRRG